jgi:hypothetical protein
MTRRRLRLAGGALRRSHLRVFRFTVSGVVRAGVELSVKRLDHARGRALRLKRTFAAGTIGVAFADLRGREALVSGRYRVTVIATGPSGRRSRPARIDFRIVGRG